LPRKSQSLDQAIAGEAEHWRRIAGAKCEGKG
jgi:hypothetical protein